MICDLLTLATDVVIDVVCSPQTANTHAILNTRHPLDPSLPSDLQAKAKNKATRAKLATQLAKVRRDIEHLAGLYSQLGFPAPAVGDIPAIAKSTPVALSSLVPADAGQEADATPPVQDSMQSIIGMLVLCKRTGASKAVDQKLATALRKYGKGRTAQTQVLVPLILADIGDYDARLCEVLALSPDGGTAVTERLTALAKQTQPDVADAAPDPREPGHHDPRYIVFGRRTAAQASLALYKNVCAVVDTLSVPGLLVLPGGVKKEPRIAMKAFLKYGGDFARVQDMSRITVVVDTLDQLALVVAALQASGYFVVVRTKNRWDPNESVLASGGYVLVCPPCPWVARVCVRGLRGRCRCPLFADG